MTAGLVVDLDDLPSFRRLVEIALLVFDADDCAYLLAVELLDAIDHHEEDDHQ